MRMGGFSLKRLVGITAAKQRVSRKLGIPLSRSGRERKVGALVLRMLMGSRK
jgi:hypothetical protein